MTEPNLAITADDRAYQRLERRLTGARTVLHLAETEGLPCPVIVGDCTSYDVREPLTLYVEAGEHLHAWAEWLGVLAIEVRSGLWHANGEQVGVEVRVVWRDLDARELVEAIEIAMVPFMGVAS